jgi:two-component system CheB/CheR fusion protein
MRTSDLERAPAAQRFSAATGPKRILLVEDDLHVAETFAELLALEGYQVSVAHDATAGLDRLSRQPVDLVLCDLTLHGEMDGFGFAAACRADPMLRLLHLIAVSGYDRPEDRRRAQAAGFDDLVGKPVNLERIHAAIDEGRRAA